MRPKALVTAIAVGMLTLGGCSGDATQKVCDERANLSADYDTFVDDLSSGNLGDARDQLAVVKDDLADLAAAVQDLAAERRDAVQPQLDSLQQTITSLTSAGSLEELQTGFETAKQQFADLVAALGSEAGCES